MQVLTGHNKLVSVEDQQETSTVIQWMAMYNFVRRNVQSLFTYSASVYIVVANG